jgi:photosystem II stability/assembly factor-like uncharacterized protein
MTAARLPGSTHLRGGTGRIQNLVIAMACLGVASCESCDPGSGGSGGGGGGGGGSSAASWLVGEGGLMINVAHARPDDLGLYDLDLRDDLLGIACRGTREAWVVGNLGLMLATADAGATWRMLDAGVRTTLRAVALAATDSVFAVGDGGVFRVSGDGGATFRGVAAPALDWTSVAARRRDGGVALLASRQGSLHRYDAATGVVSEVVAAPVEGGALWSVVMSRDGETAVAVGDRGVMLVSRDGGFSFQRLALAPVGAGLAIRDVWLVGDKGDRYIAVGDDGLLLLGATGGLDPQRSQLGQGLTLRALHLGADGHGAIVGDAGTLFVTSDAGRSWKRIATDETRSIRGLDALEAGPHL